MAVTHASSNAVAAMALVLFSCSIVISAAAAASPTAITQVSLASIGGKSGYHLAAESQGYFTKLGINVTFVSVPNSQVGFQGMQNGSWPLFQAVVDNLVARWTNEGVRWAQAVAGVDLGKGVGLYGSTRLDITTIGALAAQNKLTVDDARSGLTPALLYILKQAGYTYPTLGSTTGFQVVGGTGLRYNALKAGHTANVSDLVYGTMLLTPYNLLAKNNTATFTLLKTLSDIVAPYQSAAIMTNKAWAEQNPSTLTRLLAAFILGDRFAKNTSNAGVMKALLANPSLGITSDAFEAKVLADVTNPVSGENKDLQLSLTGLRNVCKVRQAMNGFFNATTLAPIHVDIPAFVAPAADHMYNDRYWKLAMKMAKAS